MLKKRYKSITYLFDEFLIEFFLSHYVKVNSSEREHDQCLDQRDHIVQ